MDESGYTGKSQFQHYKSLLARSVMIDPNAWLMFLDNDDLYHDGWVKFFQEGIGNRRRENHVVETAFYSGGKLLIDAAKANVKFGDGDNDVIQYDQFANLDQELNGLVDVAGSTKENSEKDVQEYFDLCVKSEVLQKFVDATPEGILSHPFCDVRFAASLLTHRLFITIILPKSGF